MHCISYTLDFAEHHLSWCVEILIPPKSDRMTNCLTPSVPCRGHLGVCGSHGANHEPLFYLANHPNMAYACNRSIRLLSPL